jgi:methionyl aminopeptidase
VTEDTLKIAIEEMGRQKKWSFVAAKMEEFVRSHGFSVVEQFVGHGIGRNMHEEPQVPNFVSKALLNSDFWLEEGLVLAIEPMVNVGTKEVRILQDQWTVETKDRKLSAHFEHTVAMTSSGPEILSLPV